MKTLRSFKRSVLTCVVMSAPALGIAQWTNQAPIRAKLISYDANCAVFREESGTQVSLRRSSLGDLKLVAGETVIQYFAETARKHFCTGKAPQS